ncbi:MAG: hypothetical protein NZ891_08075, partial [bacterium]|nr:hypothetical protein [bacterium]MDW8164677.1 hypothetical protein [Candidatus Omnitrophota bacterium]
MKKVLLIILLFSFSLFSKVFIKDTVDIENFNEEIFIIANYIRLKGNLGNEFIGIGKNIKGNFKINGDFLSAALYQEISGLINGDFYSLGGVYTSFTGKIKENLSCISDTFKIEDSEIFGNLRVIGEKINISNVKVKGKCFIFGKKIEISGNFFNDVLINGTNIQIKEGTQISGNLIYYSPQPKEFKDVIIKGKTEWKKPYGEKFTEKINFIKKFKFLYAFLSLLFPYLMFLLFTPNLLISTAQTSGKKFLKCLLVGFFSIVIFCFVIILSFITIIGVPTGLILITIFASSLYISRGFIFIFLARM